MAAAFVVLVAFLAGLLAGVRAERKAWRGRFYHRSRLDECVGCHRKAALDGHAEGCPVWKLDIR